MTAKKGAVLYEHIANIFGCAADRKSMAHFWDLPGNDPVAVEYAIGDGVSTLELYHKQLAQIEDEELQQIFDAVRMVHETLHGEGVVRLVTNMKLGTRTDKEPSLAAKLQG